MRSTAAPSASKQSPRELPQEAARGAAGSTSFRGAHADPRKSRAVEHRHQHHQQQQHRRSRESPQGDSETDDSDFPEPANSTNRARAATQPVVASPGVATQVNTYLNTGPGLRKSVEGAGEMRYAFAVLYINIRYLLSM